MKERVTLPTDDSSLDPELRRQLDVIRREETPERLLDLARQLQVMLRARHAAKK